MRYSKLLTSTVSHIEAILSEEKRQLLALLSQEDTQVQCICNICVGMWLLYPAELLINQPFQS